jgi:hypothetical protein
MRCLYIKISIQKSRLNPSLRIKIYASPSSSPHSGQYFANGETLCP